MIPSTQLRLALRHRALPLAFVGALVLTPAAALAAIVQVASPTELGANDLIRWRQLVPAGQPFSLFTAPVGVVSDNGVSATLFNATSNNHSFAAEPGTMAAAFLPNSGNPNDDLLSNCCSILGPPIDFGDLTLDFATPVRGFGAYVVGGSYNYTVTVVVNGALSFTVGGVGAITDRVFPFLGVLSDSLDIYSISFSTSDADAQHYIQIDNLQLNTTAPPPVDPPSSPTPESATWAMLIVGFAGVGAALRRRPRLTPALG